MPKVELHVHLEGSVRPASLLSLAKKHRIALPANDEPGIRKWLRFRDFTHFVEVYRTISRCLREPEDFHLLVLDFMAEQAIQNVVHSEVHFTIATHARNGVDVTAVRHALVEAVRDGEKRHGVSLRLIPDIVRDDGPEAADLTLDWALAGQREDLVVALGLSGHEHLPSAPYRDHFQRAKEAGLHRTSHAGEHGGPESIRAAIAAVDPERIDHGVRAIEDETLLAELVERRLPLTVCPTSNVALGVVPDFASHPFDDLWRKGVNVSVNCDGSQVFQTNLVREYVYLHRTFGYGPAELAKMSLQGLRQAFLPADRLEALESSFLQSFRVLGQKFLGQEVEL